VKIRPYALRNFLLLLQLEMEARVGIGLFCAHFQGVYSISRGSTQEVLTADTASTPGVHS
jgi:hypothetical protein